MREILNLKQELLEGNFPEALRLTTELETMARQDKINALENFLALMISRLIAIQVIDDIYRSSINDIRKSLIEIQQRNRLRDSFYIEANLWETHYENVVPYAILIAVETTELIEGANIEQLKETIDYELLRTDTLTLIRTTYSMDAYEIDRYLLSLWSDRQIYLY
jgi:hypothetical protein